MKVFKKLAAVLLALGMMAGLAACGDKGDDKSEAGTGSEVTSESAAGEVLGEEVNAMQMETAIQTAYNATNLAITVTGTEKDDGKTYNVSYTYKFADGKVYGESTRTSEGKTEKQYVYFGKVDTVTYMWYSADNQIWDKMEFPTEEGDPTTPKTTLEEYFKYIDFFGGYMNFEEKTGMYSFSTLGKQAVAVKVVGGKIVEFIYEEGQDLRYEGEITYGGATVGEFPAVTE